MIIFGYPRRLAVNKKEVKEVRTVAERLVDRYKDVRRVVTTLERV